MIHPRTMMDYVFAEPFAPFRIHTASARTFDIRHPEMIKMGKSSVIVYLKPDGEPSGPYNYQDLSYLLIESIETLATKSSAGSPS